MHLFYDFFFNTGRWSEKSERRIPEINSHGKDVSLLSVSVDEGLAIHVVLMINEISDTLFIHLVKYEVLRSSEFGRFRLKSPTILFKLAGLMCLFNTCSESTNIVRSPDGGAHIEPGEILLKS